MTHKYIQKRCMARNLEAHHKTEEMDVRIITSHYKSLQVIRLDTQVHWKEIQGKELGSPSQDRNGHMYILKLFLHHNNPVDGTRLW
jgi:hypothetical protein